MASVTVLHVLAPGREGGLERVVQMLASAQGSRAHVAAVITPDAVAGHPFVAGLSTRGIAHTVIVAPSRGYVTEFRELRATIVRTQPLVVHTHGFRADIIGGVAARASGRRVVSTLHGFTAGAESKINRFLHNHALRKADAVIAVSAPVAERLATFGVHATRIHPITNGFVEMGAIAERRDARRALGIPDEHQVVGWVGRLSPEKGADVMIEALARSDTSWRLSLIGSGIERDRLEAMSKHLGLADRVRWHGSVSQAGALLRAFDVFVLSSRTEGTPIALLEAMAAGVPIVTTRVGGIPDVVGDAEAILVPSETPAAIATALAAIRNDPESARRRVAAARERLSSRFGTGPWLDAIETVYNSTRSFTSP